MSDGRGPSEGEKEVLSAEAKHLTTAEHLTNAEIPSVAVPILSYMS